MTELRTRTRRSLPRTHFPGRLRSAIVCASHTFGTAQERPIRRTDDDVVHREHVSRPCPGRGIPLAPVGLRHRLYGGRLEHPVLLDAVRSRDSEGARLGARRDPDGLQHLRGRSDVEHAIRRPLHRPVRTTCPGPPWRRADGPGVGRQLLRHHAPRLLRGVGYRRSRSRGRVRDLHQQLVEVVSGQTGPGSRVDRGRLRFRHDPHRHPDRQHDCDRWIPGHVLYLWLDPGRGDLPLRLVPARASARCDHVFGERRAVPARLHRSARRFAHPCSGSCW